MDTDDEHIEGLAASARRMAGAVRVRIGVGAGVVLLIAALAVAVAISAFTPHGDTRTVTAMTAANGPPGSAAADGTAAAGAEGAGMSAGTADAGTTAGATDAGGRGTGAARVPPAQASAASAPLFVHVLGAVRNPGLFQVYAGARVVDAVAAAGGFADDANQGGVNLARTIADGEQIVVPRVGEDLPPPLPGTAAGGSAGAGAGAGAGGVASAATPVNINTASTAELETLPRIGPAMAQRIVDWRAANGRFTSVDDLLSVTGIGQKTLDGFRDLVRL